LDSAVAERPRVYAIVGATVVPAPGQQIDAATVVLRDGLIEAVGVQVEPPPDGVRIEGQGLWVYAGLVDPDSRLAREGTRGAAGAGPSGGRGGSRAGAEAVPVGAAHPLPRIHPERRVLDQLRPFEGDRKREVERLRELGFTVILAVPDSGIFRGTSAAILLRDDTPVPELVLRDGVAQHVAFERGRFGEEYPTSLMGCVSAIRQALLDAERHALWSERYARHPAGMRRPEHLAGFEALAATLSGKHPVFFHVDDPADALLADGLAREFGLDAVVAGSGHEWEIAERLRIAGRPLILPVGFPDKPRVDDDDEALEVTVQAMRRYVEAPAAAVRLHAAGVPFAFTTRGLDNLADFFPNLRKILDAGLPEPAALAALTTAPAKLLGIDRVAGTLEPGKLANLMVLDGPLFAESSRVKRVFVDGVEYRVKEKKKPAGGDPDAVVDPRGEWSVVFEFPGRTVQRAWSVTGRPGDYAGTAETETGTVAFEAVRLVGNMLTVTYPPREGRGAFELTVVIRGERFEGSAEIGARSIPVRGTRTSRPEGTRQ
jgi:imidazolonepropionase-like amidohydrolase